jgi:hypothetical protein
VVGDDLFQAPLDVDYFACLVKGFKTMFTLRLGGTRG